MLIAKIVSSRSLFLTTDNFTSGDMPPMEAGSSFSYFHLVILKRHVVIVVVYF